MIELKRNIKVKSFDIEAVIARGQDRPEFLAVACLADSLRRPIGARDVLKELLGNLPDVVGWRVIERCVALGLLERSAEQGLAQLSEAGKAAVNTRSVLVPEEGIWRIFYSDDPLLPHALIHAERLDSGEAGKSSSGKNGQVAFPTAAPRLIQDYKGGTPCLSLQDHRPFQLISLAPTHQGMEGPAAELIVEIVWEEGHPSPRITVAGSVKGMNKESLPIQADLSPEVLTDQWSWEELHQELVFQATFVPMSELMHWRQLNGGKALIPACFENLPDASRKSFARDVTAISPRIEGLGEAFEDVTLRQMPLVPSSEADAQAWLEWLQWENLLDHALPRQLEEKAEKLCQDFRFHQPVPATPGELLARAHAERQDPRSWCLIAPADLGLWS